MRILRHPGILLAALVGVGTIAACAPATANLALPVNENVVAKPTPFGEDLLWVSQRDGETFVRVRSATGDIRTVLTIPAVPHVVPQIEVTRTVDKVGIIVTTPSKLTRTTETSWWAAPGEPFVEAPPCTIAVGHDYVLASSLEHQKAWRQCDDSWFIRTTGSGPRVARAVPWFTRVAGDFYAYVDDDDGDAIHVRNWRTGAELFVIPGSPTYVARYSLELGESGTVRYEEDGGPMMVATPADPVPRVDTVFAKIKDYFLEFQDGLALDRGRLTWMSRPCGRAWIMDWDLRTARPQGPTGVCGIPRLQTPRVIRIRHSIVPAIAMRVEVTCPRATDGCDGELQWHVVSTKPKEGLPFVLALRSLRLRPGESRLMTPVRSYRGRWGRPLRLELSGYLRGASDHALRRSIPIRRRPTS